MEELGGGETLVAVDATSNEEWTYIDLDGERVVIVDDPFAESSWDLAFQRYRVKANGGASGNGEVAVAALGTDDFYQTVDIESVEWLTDSGSARGKYAFTAEGAWYQYRMRSHSLESREDVKLVRSTDGVVYRLQRVSCLRR